MRKLGVLIGYELQHYCFSPFFYAICALFLVLMGTIFFFSLKVYADFPQDEPLMMQLFKSMWLPLLFIVPILTTKAIASEKTEKLFDSLLLLRVNPFSIVFGKFFAIYLTYVGLWSMVSFFPEMAQRSVPSLTQFTHFATPQFRWGGWLFVNLIGGFVVAWGLFISAHTKTAATAMAATVVSVFLFLISGQIFKHVSVVSLDQGEIFSSLYNDWNVFFQLEDFCRGIFDTRVIVAYLTATFAILTATAMTLRKN